ncbi:MAG TPA: PQQ-dependent sugar dehydrogenase [Nanoarchaeota archaeon]|nr:PQQ-dependent sugar dehydrogenase [Nanoarchaeota archaeon]
MQGLSLKNKGSKAILITALLAIILVLGYSAFYRYISPPAPSIESFGEVGIKLIADGLASPADIAFPDDETGRLFVADRPGIVKLINSDGSVQDEPFLDITGRVASLSPSYDERGLLGIAFHQKFRENGRLYVFYNAELRNEAPAGWDSTIRVSEFRANEPNKADPASERIIMELDKPYMNHNGGQIIFGPDGFLYVSTGDGGNANDVGTGHNAPIGNGQDTFSLLGKILRIDVDSRNSGKEYGIPKDNPFSDGKEGLEEIYAYGFRNPWRMSFDEKGRLFAGDAGQNLWEEIDLVDKGGNYGWNIREGAHCFDINNADKSPETCASTGYRGEPLLEPVIEYPNANQKDGLGRTNVGGFMYTGNAIPELRNKFIFADWSIGFINGDGTLFAAEPQEKGLWLFKELKIAGKANGRLGEFILSLGRDSGNELYLLATENAGPGGSAGRVYKLAPAIA